MRQRIRAIVRNRRILRLLVARDLKVKYADSYLGYLWSVLDPLLMALVFWFVFTVIFSRGDIGAQPYIVFLLCGLLPWNWFNGAVGGSCRAISGASKLIRSTNLPREIWVLRLVGSKFAEFLLSLPVVIVFALFLGPAPSWYILALPLAMLIQAVLLVGLTLLVASVSVLVRDIERLIKIVMRILFYMSPVIYSVQNVPPRLLGLYSLNPMAGIIDLYRAALFPEEFVGWWIVGVSALVSSAVLGLGFLVFARLESAVLKEL